MKWLVAMVCVLSTACGDADVFDPGGALAPEQPAGQTNDDTSLDDPVLDDVAAPDDVPETEVVDETPEPAPACGCPIGDGNYCGARAMDLANAAGCELDPSVGNDGALYNCESGAWTAVDACTGECAFDDTSSLLDDHCELPECECFVQVAWCGSGAADIAQERGCQIPLLPKHRGDILHCPGGEWAVKEACDDGCIEAPAGTPDICKTKSDYLLPIECPQVARCTNGNNTGTHTGNDHYAYDFGMPVGTDVVAMRGGRVFRVRNVSPPGSACHNGGSTSCANYANTVEIKHSDGTIGLYMHLKRGTVSVGDTVRQGDKIGVSGNSGWSTGPHLHVQIQQNCGSWWCQSIPFTFGEKRNLSAGVSAPSANCRD